MEGGIRQSCCRRPVIRVDCGGWNGMEWTRSLRGRQWADDAKLGPRCLWGVTRVDVDNRVPRSRRHAAGPRRMATDRWKDYRRQDKFRRERRRECSEITPWLRRCRIAALQTPSRRVFSRREGPITRTCQTATAVLLIFDRHSGQKMWQISRSKGRNNVCIVYSTDCWQQAPQYQPYQPLTTLMPLKTEQCILVAVCQLPTNENWRTKGNWRLPCKNSTSSHTVHICCCCPLASSRIKLHNIFENCENWP